MNIIRQAQKQQFRQLQEAAGKAFFNHQNKA